MDQLMNILGRGHSPQPVADRDGSPLLKPTQAVTQEAPDALEDVHQEWVDVYMIQTGSRVEQARVPFERIPSYRRAQLSVAPTLALYEGDTSSKGFQLGRLAGEPLTCRGLSARGHRTVKTIDLSTSIRDELYRPNEVGLSQLQQLVDRGLQNGFDHAAELHFEHFKSLTPTGISLALQFLVTDFGGALLGPLGLIYAAIFGFAAADRKDEDALLKETSLVPGPRDDPRSRWAVPSDTAHWSEGLVWGGVAIFALVPSAAGICLALVAFASAAYLIYRDTRLCVPLMPLLVFGPVTTKQKQAFGRLWA